MSIDSFFSKMTLLEALQSKELRVYQNFLDSLQRHIKVLLPNVDKADVLNEMMVTKKTMMDEVTAIEEELSHIRREIAELASSGSVLSYDDVERIKGKDIQIIETISQISRCEQELTKRIQERMEDISSRLKEIGNTKKIKKQYGSAYGEPEIKKNTDRSYLDYSG